MFTYAHVKWFCGQSERAYYLNYFIKCRAIESGNISKFNVGVYKSYLRERDIQ